MLEDHAVCYDLIFIHKEPSPVRALLASAPVFQHPLALLVLDSRLHLRYELVVDSDVAVGRSANYQLLVFVLAYATVGQW